jgi:hypothetical protein
MSINHNERWQCASTDNLRGSLNDKNHASLTGNKTFRVQEKPSPLQVSGTFVIHDVQNTRKDSSKLKYMNESKHLNSKHRRVRTSLDQNILFNS